MDVRRVVVSPALNTPAIFYEIFPSDNFLLFFYRQPTIPNLETGIDDLSDEVAMTYIL